MNHPLVTISSTMLRDHLAVITVGWFDHRNLPPPSVKRYAPYMDELREELNQSADLSWFILGLQHLLQTSTESAQRLMNTRFAFTERECREILEFILTELEAGSSRDKMDQNIRVELKEMSTADWRALRAKQSI